MNTAISELSLYRVTQDLDNPLLSIAIGADTLKSYVESIIDLAREQKFPATIWVKLPQTKSWLNEIQKYQQQGNVECIYLCSSQKDRSPLASLKNTSPNTDVRLIKLPRNSLLQRESFLAIMSPNFCALIVAQWQKGKVSIESSGKRLQQPYLEMVSSFQPDVINTVLSKISPTISDADSRRLFSTTNTSFTPPSSQDSTLIVNLLLKQIQKTEIARNTIQPPSRQRSPESSSGVIGLQDDFLNNLVRELRSPITHMKTALSLLESKQIKGEQRQRYLKMVSDECDRQNSLVGGLLEILQLDAPLELEYIQLDAFVPGIVSTYQPLAEEKNIRLGYTIPSDLPPVSCPASWLRQIIINLLNNSLQFTPPEGKMFVQAALKNEYIELLVSDTGIGIETKELSKIFDGFYRTKSVAKDKAAGAGLGLTLVKQLTERCGGSISVTSKPNKGTTFKISLPAVPPELISASEN